MDFWKPIDDDFRDGLLGLPTWLQNMHCMVYRKLQHWIRPLSTPASLDEASLQQINIDPEYSWFLVETDLPTSSKPQLFDRFYVMTHDAYIWIVPSSNQTWQWKIPRFIVDFPSYTLPFLSVQVPCLTGGGYTVFCSQLYPQISPCNIP